jgi:hypothetical protein
LRSVGGVVKAHHPAKTELVKVHHCTDRTRNSSSAVVYQFQTDTPPDNPVLQTAFDELSRRAGSRRGVYRAREARAVAALNHSNICQL